MPGAEHRSRQTPPVAQLCLVRRLSRFHHTMNTFALIITCFAGLFAFAFLAAGCMSIVAPDEDESAENRRKLAELPSRGLAAQIQRYCYSRYLASRYLSRIGSHWCTRPQARRLVWIGLVFFVTALISGQFAAFPR